MSISDAVEGLLGERWEVWSTFSVPELTEKARNTRIAGITIDSLTPTDARAMHGRLRDADWYLGAVEIIPSMPLHMAVFLNSMPTRFRIFEDSLYVFHRQWETECDDSRDHGEFKEWKASGIFANVQWEDSGVRETIFDPFQEVEDFQRLGELDELILGQFSSALGETLIRCADADPNLMERLHGALKAFENHESSEGLAHVSLSCRRFTEKLADCLYPPRDEKVNDRKVGKAEYRNRLWAYIAENVTSDTTRQLLMANIADLGNRIDRLDNLSNKGLHSEVSTSDVNRLLLSLIVVAHDLLTLSPPAGTFRYDPYEKFIRQIFENSILGSNGE
ncbi:hypothetical protein [Streptomyces liangshanensis]|uniref:Uncharacterized protein n=1 Tax=Streptomyces liangshanensis TaxID=2717324 RepID=A0A6G9H1T5_9ACTN|nr:hypothetical protein [Streptomyces liangshanensis]QIQ04488.1 hypothetical protein HA039_21255 [Streptomyces liangshanensis]